MAWTNNDGLYIRYGTEKADMGRAGEYNLLGPLHMTEIAIDLTDLGSSAAIMSPTVTIPNGAMIEKVEVVVTEVSVGTNSNFNLGLIDQDRTTELDYDGLVAAGDAWHEAAIGTTETYTQGSTEHGALVGTVLTNTGLITAHYDTGAFTDGKVTCRIYWSKPTSAPNL